MSDKAAHGETQSLASLHAASDVMIPGGRSSVINSVASRTQTPCWAHSNEWGSSVPPAGISTVSGSHSFRNDKKSFFLSHSSFEMSHYTAKYLTLRSSFCYSYSVFEVPSWNLGPQTGYLHSWIPQPFQASNSNQAIKASTDTIHIYLVAPRKTTKTTQW